MREIKLAETAGFCYGVNRAVEMVYKLLEDGRQVATLGPIIHNPQVVEDMRQKGALVVEELGEVPKGYILVLRSHGVSHEIISEIEENGLEYADATCPFVKVIHKHAEDALKNGEMLIVAGDAEHPEVRGIVSYYEAGGERKAIVVKDNDELENALKNAGFLDENAVSIVAQTTFNTEEWDKSIKTLKKLCTNPNVFDTICNATAKRQREARLLAEDSDVMIIVGGRESSNTAKLYNICKEYCTSYLIETADELPRDLRKPMDNIRIGITAGASTPATIIKEVLVTMTDQNLGTENFEEMLEESLKKLNTDEKVHGVVVSITPTEVYVDVGRKQAGFIPVDELSQDPNVRPEDVVKVGDEVELLIMKTNDQEGTIMLSKRRVDAMKGWDELEEAIENNEVLEGKVIEVVKGGVIVLKDAMRVFVPASQATLNRGADLEELKGQEVKFRILEVDRKRRRAVGSIRSVLSEERKATEEKFWENINEDDKFTGKVKSLTNFGAFVDLGGVDGMVHISELAWNRIKHPSEVLNIGDTVNVYVKKLDRENRKISLGYKDPADNPWEKLKNEFPEGSEVEVTVAGMTPFGAFATIMPGIDGLIHISQITDHRIEKPQDVLKIGEKVKAKITEIDHERNRVSLSIRALLDEAKEALDEAASESKGDEMVYEAGPDAHIGEAPEGDDSDEAPTSVSGVLEQTEVEAGVAELNDDAPYVTEIDGGLEKTHEELVGCDTAPSDATGECAVDTAVEKVVDEVADEAGEVVDKVDEVTNAVDEVVDAVVDAAEEAVAEKPKRKRRTKAEIEADKAAEEAAKAAEDTATE